MTDYKPQERQDLEELYRKQNVRIYELEQENKKLKATIEAYAKQVNRLETRLLKYEKIHDGKFVDKSITTNESKSLFND